jgi:hypothetical protein
MNNTHFSQLKKKHTINSRKQRLHRILLCHGNKLLLWPLLGGGGMRGILSPV